MLNRMPAPGALYWAMNKTRLALLILLSLGVGVGIATETGWRPYASAAAAASFHILATPEAKNYRALGLTTALWRRHAWFTIAVATALTLALAVTISALTGGNWLAIALYCVLVPLMAAQVKPDPEPRLPDTTTSPSDVAKIAAASPLRTLVTVPLLKGWAAMWAVIIGACAIAMGMVFVLSGGEEMWTAGGVALWVIGVMSSLFVSAAINVSFASYLAVGGTRKAWIRAYCMTSLLSVGIAVLVAIGAYLMVPGQRGFAIAVVMFGMWAPIAYLLLEFMKLRLALPYIAVAVVMAVIGLMGAMTWWLLLVLSAATYGSLYFYLSFAKDHLAARAEGWADFLGLSQKD